MSNWAKVMGELISRTSSGFTNIVVINFVIGGLSYLVYLKAGTLWVFLPEMVVLAYTVYSHEFFVRTMPHMLSSKTVIQKIGMKQGALGTDKKEVSENVIDQEVSVPNTKEIGGGK